MVCCKEHQRIYTEWFALADSNLNTLDLPVMEGVNELLAISLKSSDFVSFKYSEPDFEETEQKTINEPHVNVRSEPLTTRRCALQPWMDGSSSSNSTVDLPDGVPPAPSRSKNDRLSKEEMIATMDEVVQGRKMQVEKATKESED
ncbi:HIT zinc finger [Zea mays]|uniref:HIT zinc finger n=1 Tax=Zea mays TaxID=4577 RepID=A0A1D6K0Z3_MAIZE|nr:HIT zinc finger [Zea mays]